MTISLKKYNSLQIRQMSVALMLMVSVLIMVFVPSADASLKSALEGMIKAFKGGVLQTITDIFTGDYYKSIMVDHDITTTISNVVKTTAYGLIILHCVIEILQNVNKGADWIEQVMRALSQMVMSAIIIINMDAIMDGIGDLGNAIMKDVSSTSQEAVSDLDITVKTITGKDDPGITDCLGGMVTMLIPFCFIELVSVVAQFAAFSIIIEIAIRRAFAPIALADCISEGARSPGFRYFKRYLAVYLKMAVSIAIVAFASIIAGSALSAFTSSSGLDSLAKVFSGLFTVVAVNFTAVGMMLKAGEYTNDIVGA